MDVQKGSQRRLSQFLSARGGAELVKVAGVAPTEMQELGGGSQSQPANQPPSCRISRANSSCVFAEAFLAIN